jgi:hypothetical protein
VRKTVVLTASIDGIADGRTLTECLGCDDPARLLVPVALAVSSGLYAALTGERQGRAFPDRLPCLPEAVRP